MNQRLRINICGLPIGVANSEVVDLKERAKRYIDPALRDACLSWHKHFVHTLQTRSPIIELALRQFLEDKFLFWLEVLSILGAAGEAAGALEKAEKWLNVCCTLSLPLFQNLT